MSDADAKTKPLSGGDTLRRLVEAAPQIVSSLQMKPETAHAPHEEPYACFDEPLRKLLSELEAAKRSRRTPGGVVTDCRTALAKLVEYGEKRLMPARAAPLRGLLPEPPAQARLPITFALVLTAAAGALFIVSGLHATLRPLIEAGAPIRPWDLLRIRPVDLIVLAIMAGCLLGAFGTAAPAEPKAGTLERLGRLTERRLLGDAFYARADALLTRGHEDDDTAAAFVDLVMALAADFAAQTRLLGEPDPHR